MSARILKVLGWIVAVLLVLGVGVAAGGTIVYAMTRAERNDAIQLVRVGPSDSEPGVLIASVVSGGPATEAGVARGDILLELDDEAADDAIELVRILGEHEPGDEVTLTVLHGDDERILTAILDERGGKPYLGIVPCRTRIGPEQPRRVFEGRPGAMIVGVEPDSPADEAGLQEGAVIVTVDGQGLDEQGNLADAIANYGPGDEVTLGIGELGPDEETREVTVELGEHPEREGVAYLGVRYRPVPALSVHVLKGERMPFRFDERRIMPFRHWGSIPLPPDGDVLQGGIVRSVKEDGPAEAAGLRDGDVIVAIDGDSVKGPHDLVDAIAEHKPGDRVVLTIYRLDSEDEEGEEREIQVTLGRDPDEEGKAYLGVTLGGFIRVRHSEGGNGNTHYYEFDMDLDWDGRLDDLPFELEQMEKHLELHLPPDGLELELDMDDLEFEFEEELEFHFDAPSDGFESIETTCCGSSI